LLIPEREARAVETVLFPYTTGQIGGSHISGTSLAAGLSERYGVRSIVIAPDGAEVLDLAHKLGLETMVSGDPAKSRYRPDRDLLRTPARMALVNGLGGQRLVHCNDLAALQSWGPAARALGVPAIYHNRAFDRPIWPNRLVIRLARHVISISQACDARLGFLPARRRSILTNPFSTNVDTDAAAARAALLRDLGAPSDVRIIGFVGNFWPRKRPTMFVDIARRLAADDPSLRFVMFGRAGEISVAQMREKVVEAGLADRLLLAGFRLPPEANLAALDLLLMPALDEPFGRTLVEALLLGVPYVAANDAGHAEIHGRWGGGLAPAVDAGIEVYAEACRQVLAAPAVVRLPMARRRAISAELTPTMHAAEVMQVYAGLIS
jgi:glycosyltransferase involved in cell wall biosynthesis